MYKMLKNWTHLHTYKQSLLMIFHNVVFICQYKSVEAIFIRVLACFQTGLTVDVLTNDCRRWARRALQSLVTTPQPVQTDPVNALGSNQSHRFSSKGLTLGDQTQLKLMPAWTHRPVFHFQPSAEFLQVILNPNYCTFTVIRMIAWMNPQHGLPGLKGYFDGSGMFDERELCHSSPWY